jgi:ribosomal protein L10
MQKFKKKLQRQRVKLTFREESRLRVFKNTMLRRVFGPKRDEATGE